MHVVINGLSITNRSGTGRYTWGLIHGLLNPRHPDIRFTVFIPSDYQIPSEWSTEENIKFISIPIHSAWHRILWEQWMLPGYLKQLRPDILHSPAFIAPVFAKTPVQHIITVHDLAYQKYPETIPRARRWYYHFAIQKSMRLAHTIFTDSITVAREMHEMPYAPKRIIALPLGVNHLQFHPDHLDEDFTILNQYNISKPYFLFVGTQEPRKNLPTLITAYAQARNQGVTPSLVLCGRLGWMQDDGLSRQPGVQTTGFVPEHHLPAIYRHARALVAPSLYEGYDLPVMEASACGTAVIASDIPVHREVLEKYASYVDVKDTEAWVHALLCAEDNPLPRYTKPIRHWSDMAEEVYVTYQLMKIGDELPSLESHYS